MDLINCSLVLSSQQSSTPPPEAEKLQTPASSNSPLGIFPPPNSVTSLPSFPSLPLTPSPSLSPTCQHSPPTLTSAQIDPLAVLPGLSQPIESDESLLEVLNSSPPPQFLPEPASQLPIYRGKDIYQSSSGASTSSSIPQDIDKKSVTWSRGLGVELSPLQTRSSRKKKVDKSAQPSDPTVPAPDGKALRALKALARTK